MQTKADSVVGTATSDKWSQVVKVVVPDGELLMLVGVVYVGEGDVLEVAEIGGGVLEILKSGIGVGKWDLEVIKSKVEDLWEGIGDGVELVVLVAKIEMHSSRLLVVAKGAVELYLNRNDQTARIIAGEKKVSGVQGEIVVGDKIGLCTRELVEKIGLRRIEEVIKNEDVLEQLAVAVHGQQDSSMMAMMRGEVRSETQENKSKRINKRDNRARKKVGGVWAKIQGWGKRPMQIKQEQKKHNIWIGAGLIIILLIGVGIGVVKRQKTIKEYRYSQVESLVENKVSEARSIADLNPERAKGLLSEARREVESYLLTEEEGGYYSSAEQMLASLEIEEQQVFREETVSLEILVESELFEISEIAEMVVDENNILLVAKNGEEIVGVSTEDKSSWKSEVSEVGEVKGAGVFGKDGYLLAEKGVYQVSLEGGKGELVIEPDELWVEATELSLFAGNAYVLDTGQGEIWKYPALTDGFGARRRWLGAGIVLDLSRVIDMEVDGDIWIVTSTGKLERYSRGVPVSFSMEGFPAVESGSLVGPKAVSTTEEKVYVLEAGAGRVIVFEKETGRYEKQLVNEDLKKGEEMVVVDNKGYVLMSDRIVWFEL